MKLVRVDPAAATPDRGSIFEGDVLRQNLVAEGDTALLRVTAITFRAGARNKLHKHSTDQVLVATAGRGIVANEVEMFHVEPGDVVLIPRGEPHWHGAEPGEDFAHLSILTPGEMTILG